MISNIEMFLDIKNCFQRHQKGSYFAICQALIVHSSAINILDLTIDTPFSAINTLKAGQYMDKNHL